jgi:hypothetical protein
MPSDHPVAADVAKLEGWVSIRHVGLQICLLTWSFSTPESNSARSPPPLVIWNAPSGGDSQR